MTAPTLTYEEHEALILDRLAAPLRERVSAGAVLAAAVDPDDLRHFTSDGLEGLRARATVSWEHAAAGVRLFGIGVAARFGAPRGDSTRSPESVLGQLRLETDGRISAAAKPRFFGGFQFDDAQPLRDGHWDALGGWQFVLPRVLIAWSEGGVSGSVCVAHGFDDAQPSANVVHAAPSLAGGLDTDAWQAAVAAAVGEIRNNQYAKTVLARQRHIKLGPGWSREATLSALAERYPGCFVFQFGTSGATWLGASPERLVSLADGVARADSLAGSCRRGANAEEDRQLAEQLLADPKERDEHAFVVRAISQSLAPHTVLLEHPAEPAVMQLANIQHLHTPVLATVQPGTTIFDLVRAMHPTPAVGGWPRAQALDAIRRLEKMDRGWYAAPVGWLDFDGNGEFAVGLRSALITPGEATLFAGAGIVEESDPQREVAEIGLKFKPLEEALKTGGAWT